MNTKTKRVRRTAVAAGTALVVLLAVAAGLGMLASAAPAASPIYVRKGGDDANCDGTLNVAYPGGGPGLQCAVKTIQKGIELVDPGGTVIVAGGVYGENVDIPKDLTLQGAGAGSTIIDAGSVGRGIHVDLSVDTTVSGVTIRNGNTNTDDGAGIHVSGSGAFTLTGSTVSNNTCSGGDGAGLYLGSGTTTFISGCSFVNNTGSEYGGAIFSSENTLTIVGSTFTGNEATDTGGAIRGAGGTLTVIESTLSNNATTRQEWSHGGGIYHNGGTLVISNTTIANNTTTSAGGGVYNGGTARIAGSAITGNSGNNTTSCHGGGVYNSYGSTLTIEDSVLRGNWVSTTFSSTGGGIWSNGRTTLNRVTVSGNWSTGYAGGIHSQNELTMTNVTVSGNEAYYTGGLVQTGGAVGTLTNCTIANNTISGGPPRAGGIYVVSTVNMANTLLADNDNRNCDIGLSGTLNSGGHNLEDGDSCNPGGTGDIKNTDPLLFLLGDFGGPSVGAPGSEEKMRLHALGWGSPAIDAFKGASCPAVDQRGVSRPVDGDDDGTAACDIGAFELDGLHTVFLPLVLREY
jgi:predicted outer membrane repeat protein